MAVIDPRQERINQLMEAGIDNWARSGKRISYNIWKLAQLKAAEDSSDFYVRNMLTVPFVSNQRKLRQQALAQCTFQGLNFEFGVASGKSINLMAAQYPDRKFYGFDGFGGLPEAWRSDFQKGHFAQPIPDVAKNVELVPGWFNETLRNFLEKNEGPVSFLHVDCDLYSSTKTIFDELTGRIVPGTVIVFDEYFNYPGWQYHEHKAWTEFVHKQDVKFEYLALVPTGQQVALKVLAINSDPSRNHIIKARAGGGSTGRAEQAGKLLAQLDNCTSIEDLKKVVHDLIQIISEDQKGDGHNNNYG